MHLLVPLLITVQRGQEVFYWLNQPLLAILMPAFMAETEDYCFHAGCHPSTDSLLHIDCPFVSRVRLRGRFHCRHESDGLAKVVSATTHLKCRLRSETGMSLPKSWKQPEQLQARCTSARKHWLRENSIPCPQAFLRLLTASLLWLADHSKRALHLWGITH